MSDDIAIKLFTERDAAVEFAKTMSDDIPDAIMQLYGMDPTGALGIVMLGFDAEGSLASHDILRWFEDEPRDGATG